MPNLRECRGSYKGLIGECLFKLSDKDVIVTRFFNRQKWFGIFTKYLTPDEARFLHENWFSIDALKVDYKNKKVFLYEVKMRNKYRNPRFHWKPKFTKATADMYTQAIGCGFHVAVATVWLLSDWDYEIELQNFGEVDYCVDKPKPYDRGSNRAIRK